MSHFDSVSKIVEPRLPTGSSDVLRATVERNITSLIQ